MLSQWCSANDFRFGEKVMKDYYAPDWWYEPPVEIDDQEQDLLDERRECASEDLYLSEIEHSSCQVM
jgi:hypothetical protein